MAADWLAAAWDQNAGLYVMSPAGAVAEEVAGRWVAELLGLPENISIAFTTGCHMANFTALAAARHEVLRRAGWDVESDGLQRAPACAWLSATKCTCPSSARYARLASVRGRSFVSMQTTRGACVRMRWRRH